MREVGTPDNKRCLEPMWPYDLECAGPVFNRKGGTSPDWDLLAEVPILIETIDADFEQDIRDVFSGKFLQRVRRNMRDKTERDNRHKAKLLAKGERLANRIDNLTTAMAEDWNRMGRRDIDTPRYIAKKHLKQELKKKHLDALDGNFSEREKLKTFFYKQAGY